MNSNTNLLQLVTVLYRLAITTDSDDVLQNVQEAAGSLASLYVPISKELRTDGSDARFNDVLTDIMLLVTHSYIAREGKENIYPEIKSRIEAALQELRSD